MSGLLWMLLENPDSDATLRQVTPSLCLSSLTGRSWLLTIKPLGILSHFLERDFSFAGSSLLSPCPQRLLVSGVGRAETEGDSELRSVSCPHKLTVQLSGVHWPWDRKS